MVSQGASSLDSITALWPEILEKTKKMNYALYMSLRMSAPIKLVNETLTIGFLYQLQKNKLENIDSTKLFKGILTELTGNRLEIESVIDQNLNDNDFKNANGNNGVSVSNKTLDDSVNEIANVFDGEVVN